MVSQTIPALLIDTDVVSFIFKRDSRAELYRPYLAGNTLAITFMTVAELERWSLERNWGVTRRALLEEHLRAFVVTPVNRALCHLWAVVCDGERRAGRRISGADAWQAAAALHYNIPLVTHNYRHFFGVAGLRVVSAVQA